MFGPGARQCFEPIGDASLIRNRGSASFFITRHNQTAHVYIFNLADIDIFRFEKRFDLSYLITPAYRARRRQVPGSEKSSFS
jgi:hypothetical protein